MEDNNKRAPMLFTVEGQAVMVPSDELLELMLHAGQFLVIAQQATDGALMYEKEQGLEPSPYLADCKQVVDAGGLCVMERWTPVLDEIARSKGVDLGEVL